MKYTKLVVIIFYFIDINNDNSKDIKLYQSTNKLIFTEYHQIIYNDLIFNIFDELNDMQIISF